MASRALYCWCALIVTKPRWVDWNRALESTGTGRRGTAFVIRCRRARTCILTGSEVSCDRLEGRVTPRPGVLNLVHNRADGGTADYRQ